MEMNQEDQKPTPIRITDEFSQTDKHLTGTRAPDDERYHNFSTDQRT